MAPVIDGGFLAPHACIEALHGFGIQALELAASGRAIVCHEDQDRVLRQSEFFKSIAQQAEIVIDIGDHAVKIGAVAPCDTCLIRGRPGRCHPIRAVRRIGGDVQKEGSISVRLNKTKALSEPHVRAVAFECLEGAVALVGIVEVIVSPVIRGLPHTTAAMPDHVLKPTILGTVRRIVTQMPLAHHASDIPVVSEQIRHSFLVRMHHRTSGAGAIGACTRRVMPGHQGRTRGRTERAHMEIGQAYGLAMQTIEIGCLEDWIAVTAQVAIPLIIGHHQDDIGPVHGSRPGCNKEQQPPCGCRAFQ